MDIQRPLFWHQGLFLQPQHFQLQDIASHSQMLPWQQLVCPHFWGVNGLAINKAALGIKSFGLIQGRFLFPDGTYVEVPGNGLLQDRSFDDAWLEGGKPLTVYVGLKRWNDNAENVTVLKKDESFSQSTTRFIGDTNAEEVKDLHAGGPVGHVKKLTYLLRTFFESETEHLGDYMLIPLAQIERQGGDIGLVPNFIPPCVSITGSERLQQLIKEIGDRLLSRSRQLEEHKSQRGLHTAEFGSRDMVYLLALRSINRYLPWLRHYAEAANVHPWHLFGILRQIVGDLSCFSEKINVLGEQVGEGANSLVNYDHLQLWERFSHAQRLIDLMLDDITAGPDHIAKMELEDGIFSTDLKPAMGDSDRYYLALTSDGDPKKAIDEMTKVAKLSSRKHLGLLISHALPGVALEYLFAPPQELPRRSKVVYFSIDTHGEQWVHVKKDRTIAFYWDGAPDGLQVELMVISR